MTANSTHQPNHAPHQKGYNPITLHDVTKPSPPSSWQAYLGELQEPIARCIAVLSCSSPLCSARENQSSRR